MKTPDFYRLKGEITNGCTCLEFNEELADWEPRSECYGYCWEDQEEDFGNQIADFLADAPTNAFRIEGFPVWNGTVDGYFTADNARQFLAAVTVRGEWFLRYEITPQAFTAVLSHHDRPTGGVLTVTPLTEDEKDAL